jgi:lipopolysaccharide export system permease protein
MGFSEYTKLLDLSSLQMNKTNESVFEQNAKMLSVRQIDKAIDSIIKKSSNYKQRSKAELQAYFTYLRFEDSIWKKTEVPKEKTLVASDSLKRIMYARAVDVFTSVKNNYSGIHADYQLKAQSQRTYKIEWQKRFTLSIACIVLFLIGAPLGSIIRKGGLGTPLVFAIAFFAVFHLLNTFGERLSNSGVTSTFLGIWMSTFVLLPIGFFLIIKAMRDSQLFNNEFYFRLFRQLKAGFGKRKANSTTD